MHIRIGDQAFGLFDDSLWKGHFSNERFGQEGGLHGYLGDSQDEDEEDEEEEKEEKEEGTMTQRTLLFAVCRCEREGRWR